MSVSLICANFFSTLLYVVLAIVILLLMVLIHELGHYVAGRMLKFKIEEFSVGFGKVLLQKTNKRGEKISLRLFPLGGFCGFAGEGSENVNDKEAFENQKPWKRVIVLFMGAFFNFISAIIFSFILLVSVGCDVKQIVAVDPASINTNLQSGDVILMVDDTKIDMCYGKSLVEALGKEHTAGDTHVLTLKRNGERIQETVTYYASSSEGNPVILGISFKNYVFNFWEALGRCIPFAVGLAWLTLKAFWLLITFRLPLSNLAGPVGTIQFITQAGQTNFANILLLLPLIAANLAMFNLLPIPALDGSHIAFTAYEGITKKRINKKVENMIHLIGFIVLISFAVIVDIVHFLS